VDADAELDFLIFGNASVALAHTVLEFEGATNRIDHAAEFDNASVTRALDDAAVMDRNCRVDQIAAERSESSEDAVFVGAGQPRVADDVGYQNCRKLSDLARRAYPAADASLAFPGALRVGIAQTGSCFGLCWATAATRTGTRWREDRPGECGQSRDLEL
jgi:hypothetical protein